MAFRPTIARGLALSAMSSFFRLLPLNTAISMPKQRGFFNRLISKNSLDLEIISEGWDYDVFRRKRGLFADSFVGEPSALNNLYAFENIP